MLTKEQLDDFEDSFQTIMDDATTATDAELRAMVASMAGIGLHLVPILRSLSSSGSGD